MKKLVTLTIILLNFSFVSYNQKVKIPTKQDVLQKMTIANKYFMEKWPDPGKQIVTDRVRASNIWTRAVYYEGLMELYKIDSRKEYLDYMLKWAEFHNWNLRDGNTFTRNADNQCAGQIYIDLYLMDPKPQRIKYIKMSIDSMLNTNKIDDWYWIDALQMAMPVFARLGKIYNDERYYKRMYEMYIYTRDSIGLYNKEEHLWWRDKDFLPPYKEPNGKNCYWSRGNGWVIAALIRTLDIIPYNTIGYELYLQDYKNMVDAIAKIQREDGFWNVSLHDPEHFGGPETTGTSLFIYGIAWGINKGILSKKIYMPIVMKAWNAITEKALHKNGFLGYVQSTGKEPKDGQPVLYDKIPDFEDFGLGCFLLAGSEIYKLAR